NVAGDQAIAEVFTYDVEFTTKEAAQLLVARTKAHRHGRHRMSTGGCHEGDGLGEALREPLDGSLEVALETAVTHVVERNARQLLAIAQGQIEVETVTTQDAGGKRLEAILVGDTRSNGAVVVRINELYIETTISLFLVTLQNAFHLAAEVAQIGRASC